MPRGSRITLFESYLYFLLLLHFILHHICQSTMSTKCRDIPQNLINQEAKNCHVSTQHLETLTFEAVITMSVFRAGCLAICTLRTNEFFTELTKIVGDQQRLPCAACLHAAVLTLVIYFLRALASLPYTYGVLHRPLDAKTRAFVNLSIFFVC